MLSGSEEFARKAFIERLNVWCYLDLKHSNPAFSLDTSMFMIYTETEFGCKRLTGLELIKDIVETVIF